jgi:hypothetical protein
MDLNEALFWRYLAYGREDDSWDYKSDFSLASKREVAEFAKDVIAFANSGGGVMLFGVDESSMTAVGVSDRVDQAAIGDVLEKRIGINIEVQLFYFQSSANLTLGLAWIPASKEVIIASRDLHGEDGKPIVQDGVIYCRRNTRSVRATSQDVRTILSRISTNQSTSAASARNELSAVQSIFRASLGAAPNIYDIITDRYEPTAQAIGAKLWEIWKFGSKYSKFEFAALLQIPPEQFDDYVEGRYSLTLGQIIAVTKMFNLRADYFFHASYNLRLPLWEEEVVRTALLHRVRPRCRAEHINPGPVYGNVLYEFAKTICEFHETIYPDSRARRLGWDVDTTIALPPEFVDKLSLQYYKVLEQYPTRFAQEDGLPHEQVLRTWFHTDSKYIARLIVEGIELIGFDRHSRVRVKYRFMEDLRRQRVRPAGYDSKNLVMTTGKGPH